VQELIAELLQGEVSQVRGGDGRQPLQADVEVFAAAFDESVGLEQDRRTGS
jgi:hypothetical protein